MLLPAERPGASPNPRHAGEDMALTAHVKAHFEEAKGVIYPRFRLMSFFLLLAREWFPGKALAMLLIVLLIALQEVYRASLDLKYHFNCKTAKSRTRLRGCR